MIEETTREDAALYALDMLQGEDLCAFEARLRTDAELATLVKELRTCSVELVNALPTVEPPPSLRASVLAAAQAEGAAPSSAGVAAPGLSVVQGGGGVNIAAPKPRLWPVLLPWGLAACFALLFGVSAFFALGFREEAREARNRAYLNKDAVLTAQSELGQLQKLLASATQENDLMRLRVATLTSQENAENLASVVWDEKRGEGVLHVQKLPANPAETVYQLWVVGDEPLPIDGGTFTVGADGNANYHFHPKTAVDQPKAFAISLEKGQGVPVREGPIVLSNL